MARELEYEKDVKKLVNNIELLTAKISSPSFNIEKLSFDNFQEAFKNANASKGINPEEQKALNALLEAIMKKNPSVETINRLNLPILAVWARNSKVVDNFLQKKRVDFNKTVFIEGTKIRGVHAIALAASLRDEEDAHKIFKKIFEYKTKKLAKGERFDTADWLQHYMPKDKKNMLEAISFYNEYKDRITPLSSNDILQTLQQLHILTMKKGEYDIIFDTFTESLFKQLDPKIVYRFLEVISATHNDFYYLPEHTNEEALKLADKIARFANIDVISRYKLTERLAGKNYANNLLDIVNDQEKLLSFAKELNRNSSLVDEFNQLVEKNSFLKPISAIISAEANKPKAQPGFFTIIYDMLFGSFRQEPKRIHLLLESNRQTFELLDKIDARIEKLKGLNVQNEISANEKLSKTAKNNHQIFINKLEDVKSSLLKQHPPVSEKSLNEGIKATNEKFTKLVEQADAEIVSSTVKAKSHVASLAKTSTKEVNQKNV